MDFTTDLNHRERATILHDLRAHIESAEKMAVAIETADDRTLMIEFVICSLSWSTTHAKIKPALTDMLNVAKAKDELEGFKGF
jgi:hypothetical protein